MTENNRLTVDRQGSWRLYTNTLPTGAHALGTVARGIGDTGALVLTHAGIYAQCNAGALRSLDQPAVRAALLRAAMLAHALTRADIARMLGLEPRPGGSHGTVDMWLSGARNIPASKLELIEIKAPNWKSPAPV